MGNESSKSRSFKPHNDTCHLIPRLLQFGLWRMCQLCHHIISLSGTFSKTTKQKQWEQPVGLAEYVTSRFEPWLWSAVWRIGGNVQRVVRLCFLVAHGQILRQYCPRSPPFQRYSTHMVCTFSSVILPNPDLICHVESPVCCVHLCPLIRARSDCRHQSPYISVYRLWKQSSMCWPISGILRS